jgi:hypothetical protein
LRRRKRIKQTEKVDVVCLGVSEHTVCVVDQIDIEDEGTRTVMCDLIVGDSMEAARSSQWPILCVVNHDI